MHMDRPLAYRREWVVGSCTSTHSLHLSTAKVLGPFNRQRRTESHLGAYDCKCAHYLHGSMSRALAGQGNTARQTCACGMLGSCPHHNELPQLEAERACAVQLVNALHAEAGLHTQGHVSITLKSCDHPVKGLRTDACMHC